MDIQWYPGHMTKTRKQIQQNLKLIDVVVELLDARIPASSRNPVINDLLLNMPRVVVLNKADLADPEKTTLWLKYFEKLGLPGVAVDSQRGVGIKQMLNKTANQARPAIQKYMDKGRRARSARCMVVGIPNVGKSMLINRLAGRSATRTGNRPGVTRGEQWIKLGDSLELLDTPGILWPKFEDPEVAFKLAVTGAIKEQIYDPQDICVRLVNWLTEMAPGALDARYGTGAVTGDVGATMHAIGAKRGFYLSGGKIDAHKTAVLIIKEFREGKLGHYTLDLPE
ncbi:ribosome biogenesis GTPase A [Desulfotomaculum arcticum]|uniref:Ribosome biogenesis GTPase A n=1 Tax=Desulfotruncus arcticus DSM 17038 TaxID=1121424 RepID=A0A1I2RHS4_9FIRM|nr:ribosome biogenesis GTPase YlqF [Desulfotruncus arcticus]SFG40214.1 ribosome biogenesis GTPase A [Desulfotomaculum arcticum] [Desulfotruncus arcticus DSM 17038]